MRGFSGVATSDACRSRAGRLTGVGLQHRLQLRIGLGWQFGIGRGDFPQRGATRSPSAISVMNCCASARSALITSASRRNTNARARRRAALCAECRVRAPCASPACESVGPQSPAGSHRRQARSKPPKAPPWISAMVANGA